VVLLAEYLDLSHSFHKYLSGVILDKKVGQFIYLMSITTVLVVGLLFIVIGVKKLNDAPDIAERIAPSKVYEKHGFPTIEAWKVSFEKKSKTKIFIGTGLIAITAAVVVLIKIRRKK